MVRGREILIAQRDENEVGDGASSKRGLRNLTRRCTATTQLKTPPGVAFVGIARPAAPAPRRAYPRALP
jgi:hypothetical protein